MPGLCSNVIGIFTAESAGERILKVSQYLAELWTSSPVLVYPGTRV